MLGLKLRLYSTISGITLGLKLALGLKLCMLVLHIYYWGTDLEITAEKHVEKPEWIQFVMLGASAGGLIDLLDLIALSVYFRISPMTVDMVFVSHDCVPNGSLCTLVCVCLCCVCVLQCQYFKCGQAGGDGASAERSPGREEKPPRTQGHDRIKS